MKQHRTVGCRKVARLVQRALRLAVEAGRIALEAQEALTCFGHKAKANRGAARARRREILQVGRGRSGPR